MDRRRMFLNAGYQYLLDTYTAYFAYSLFKLKSTYTGNCIEVRRSSDNSTTNIGFSNNYIDVVSLLSFVGAGNGFVRTWYDQSGNGYNATQTTNGNQPRIVASGVFDEKIYFNGSSSFMSIASVGALNVFRNVSGGSIFCVANSNVTSTSNCLFIATNNFSSQSRTQIQFNSITNNRITIGARRLDANTPQNITSNTDHNSNNKLISAIWDWGNSDLYLYENSLQTAISTTFQTSGNTSNTASSVITIGRFANSATPLYLDGNVLELIAFQSTQLSNRADIENNINARNNVY